MTQKEQIFRHLRATGPITPMYALAQYGCFRLAARIADLRAEGHDIRTDMIPNRNGGKFARYTLVKAAR